MAIQTPLPTQPTQQDVPESKAVIVKTLCFAGVVGLPLLVGLSNLLAFFTVNSLHPESRVADDIYKSAMAVYKNNDAVELAQQLGVNGELFVVPEKRTVSVLLNGDHGDNSQLTLKFIHPTDISQDISMVLQKTDKGIYTGQFNRSFSSYIELRLTPVVDKSVQADKNKHWEIVLKEYPRAVNARQWQGYSAWVLSL